MNVILDVKEVRKVYEKSFLAVNDISFKIKRGRCVGVVGESGSGKSTLAKLILSLEALSGGEIFYNEERLDTIRGKRLRQMRRNVQLIFQDPTASLNQRLTIFSSVMEPLDNFKEVTPSFLIDVRHSRRATAAKLMEMVGLTSEHLDRYPHQLSGGQRQRVAIARAISVNPDLLICDEPTSSLDASIQAQLMNLLKELKGSLGMSYLFISHDIGAVYFMSDEIIFMKEGRIVEQFLASELLSVDRNVYTRNLIQASS
ncbi:ABC transporter ATP-binding protein [Bacillus solitudinis]|uniref:ABC transporter ATP-binding protein n=1 Tax=Bacillus solitudinis TaxID=2014074 RepID=UPI000C242F71|nr:dipeptide/oligopeptide/nickel ABC transporter ATP-binding protein [Bacillus solitudinis]